MSLRPELVILLQESWDFDKKSKRRASEMIQQIKVLASNQAWWPESHLQDPHGGEKELIPTECFLTSKCMLKHNTPSHTN